VLLTEFPLLYPSPSVPNNVRARHLRIEPCGIPHAVDMVRAWHSRLPKVQDGPWQFAFKAELDGVTYAAALWNNPSARTLPSEWLELRRMACAPYAPRFTASKMLGWMVRWFRKNEPQRGKCISYQDTSVHLGTIYRAAGWNPAFVSKARVRDRSKNRVGTNRAYRSNKNGPLPDAAEKIRWEIDL